MRSCPGLGCCVVDVALMCHSGCSTSNVRRNSENLTPSIVFAPEPSARRMALPSAGAPTPLRLRVTRTTCGSRALSVTPRVELAVSSRQYTAITHEPCTCSLE
eukprot:3693864-Prymnesium_polylepis.1